MIGDTVTAPPELADQVATTRGVFARGRTMGSYHGEWGFQALSHRKAVLAKATKPDLKLLYPPYTDKGLKIMRRILG